MNVCEVHWTPKVLSRVKSLLVLAYFHSINHANQDPELQRFLGPQFNFDFWGSAT